MTDTTSEEKLRHIRLSSRLHSMFHIETKQQITIDIARALGKIADFMVEQTEQEKTQALNQYKEELKQWMDPEKIDDDLAKQICWKRCLNRPYMAYQAGFLAGQQAILNRLEVENGKSDQTDSE